MAGKGRIKGSPKVPGSGRRKGSLNRSTLMHRAMIERLKLDCSDPLSFCIYLLRNPDAPHEEKKWAVAQMFPYAHPKLNSIEARTGGKTHEDRLEELQRMLDDDGDD
jgi:hypothetical protein